MKKTNIACLALLVLIVTAACGDITTQSPAPVTSWQQQFDEQLQLNGHRNWILVVDKAFPQQPGMHIINTNEKLLPVLQTVLQKVNASSHVKPMVYKDAELQFLTDSLAPGVTSYRNDLQKTLGTLAALPILHDSVFVKMDAAAKLFSITVLKTEEIIPYSSVFIELDCAYWGGEKETKLRQLMKPANQ